MSVENNCDNMLLPHHVQQELCTTRLPYRQGRKLTAVKVYTISTESNHILIFGVPSLNLRREAKSLFLKFGKLIQFTLSKQHKSEEFTETYHAVYETIQSARIAKRMLDTKNFYGGSLHVCYAPEFETIDETRQKIARRRTAVLNRLRNLKKEAENESTQFATNEINEVPTSEIVPSTEIVNEVKDFNDRKLNMGKINVISLGNQVQPVICGKKRKRKSCDSKPIKNKTASTAGSNSSIGDVASMSTSELEIVDCTSTATEVITNINEHLNYDKFGNENIVKLPEKPLNKIKFFLPSNKK